MKPYEDELGHYIQKCAHLITVIANERLEAIGLTLAQMRLLRCLWNEDGLMQKEIQQHLLIKPSSVNGLVEQLLKKELVLKKIDEHDARRARIYLTQAGAVLQNSCEELFAQLEKSVSGHMDVAQKQETMKMLEGVFQNLLATRLVQ